MHIEIYDTIEQQARRQQRVSSKTECRKLLGRTSQRITKMPCGLPGVRELMHSFGIGTGIGVSWRSTSPWNCTNSAKTKLANNPSPFSCHRASVLDACRLGFMVEFGELELSLVSDMGRELSITGDIEVRPA